MGLSNTVSCVDGRDPASRCCTPSARNGGRRSASPPARRFYEESTYWNPSWTIAQGAIQTTNIDDMTAIGGGDRRGHAALAGVAPGADRPQPARVRLAAGGLPDLPHPRRDVQLRARRRAQRRRGSCRTRSSAATAR